MQAGIDVSSVAVCEGLLARYSKNPLVLLEEFAENQTLQINFANLKTLDEFKRLVD